MDPTGDMSLNMSGLKDRTNLCYKNEIWNSIEFMKVAKVLRVPKPANMLRILIFVFFVGQLKIELNVN